MRFGVVAIHDPRFAEPLLLGIRPNLSGPDARLIYRDRWPVEGVPQVAKAMLGLGRQFVSGPESRHRLPELTLLGGSSLSYLAATELACAAGFWDRAPKPTAGRLRRLLAGVHYDNLGAIPGQLPKKQSPAAHLPKGILGQRRRKRSSFASQTLPRAA